MTMLSLFADSLTIFFDHLLIFILFFFFEGGEYLEYLVIDEENGENDVIFFCI